MRRPLAFERLYLDFDSFFASAEQQLRPELRGRPVGVIPLDSPHTSLIAASREAKARGVRGIISVTEARRLVPDIALVVQRPDVYVRLHHRMLPVIDAIAPILAVRSIDEVVADISGWSREEALARARAIKRRLAAEIGPYVTCSIGLAANELLAKIAAEKHKPDGLAGFAPEHMPGPLLDLELRALPGVAKRMERRLNAAGVHDVAALLALAPKQARAIWRSVEGERFWALLHGYAIERQATQKRMFGHSRVLPYAWRNLEQARVCARLLVIKAARRMRREGYQARRFSLAIGGRRGGETWMEDISLPRASDDHTFLQALDRAWPRRWPQDATHVFVTLHGLEPAGEQSADLFAEADEETLTARWRAIAQTMDRINKRYGGAAISLGPPVSIPGGYAGGKIAFGRIPDLEDF